MWSERGKLCVAKLGGMIEPATVGDRFSQLLLENGPTPEEDRFMEVHIWGPMTIRTVERILVKKLHRQASRKSLRDRLKGLGVELEEIG